MTLSIIILSYNTKAMTKRCVDSVLKYYGENIGKDVELIVVDNASKDETVSELNKIKKLKLIKNEDNFGFSKGNNIGAKVSSGKYLLFLNSDTKALDNNFLKMVDFMDQNPKVGILGGALVSSNGRMQKSGGSFYSLLNLSLSLFGGERVGFVRKASKKTERIDWVSGACLMVRKDLFKKLKGFDEHFFMYVEDMDLAFRAKKLGFATYFYPNAKVIHEENASSNREFAVNNIYKGIIYFSKKHHISYPLVRSMLFLKATISLAIGLLTNNNYLKKTYSGTLKTI